MIPTKTMVYETESHVHQLADYIKKNISKGYTMESLKFALLNQGYSRISVNEAIEIVNKQLAAQAPKMVEKPQITYRIIPDSNEEPSANFLKIFFKWMFE